MTAKVYYRKGAPHGGDQVLDATVLVVGPLGCWEVGQVFDDERSADRWVVVALDPDGAGIARRATELATIKREIEAQEGCSEDEARRRVFEKFKGSRTSYAHDWSGRRSMQGMAAQIERNRREHLAVAA